MSWKKIWVKKGLTGKNIFRLRDLIALDGYDTESGYFPARGWRAVVARVERKLSLKKESSICEVGCGAGAFLLPLYQKGYRRLAGIDYSSSLIAVCRKVIPQGDFKIAEAKKIPFPAGKFDAVISNGVFFYFPDLQYAEAALQEIIRILKPSGWGALLDINDLSKKRQYESFKKKKIGPENYLKLYRSLPQLFYRKSWFKEMADRYHLRYELEDQSIPGYGNSRFRFNFFFRAG